MTPHQELNQTENRIEDLESVFRSTKLKHMDSAALVLAATAFAISYERSCKLQL